MSTHKSRNLPVFLFFLLVIINNANAVENNLAKYRVTFHSSSVDVNQCGHLVVDGSLSTYWESVPGKSHWLTIDLGSEQTISKIVVHWGDNYATGFKTTILKSNNDNGTLLYTGNDARGGVTTITSLSGKARIVRFDISDVKDPSKGCIIKEVEVFGDAPDRFVPSAPIALSLNNLSLNSNSWRIQNSAFVMEKPEEISSPGFNDKEWIPASVPGTIMGSYYNFGALPDPFYSDNMHQISDEFFSGNNFWYRISVKIPKLITGKRMFLNFRGINWKADIYFNSVYLGHIDGAYQRAEFEVTKLISDSKANTIAVLIHHTDTWKSGDKKVTRKYIGAPTRNGDNLGLDSPTILASAGWNWLPIIRGRNTGIWQDAGFSVRENVSINDPWVSTTVPVPDTTKADLTIHAELQNFSTDVVEGKLVAGFGKNTIEYPVKLNPGEIRSVTLDKSKFPKLALKNPKLWWPNGYGAQNLHKLSLRFIAAGKISDSEEITFGIRQIDTKVTNNILLFYCNGQRILLRGGNWGLPEGMIRCDSAGYDLRVKLHKDANFNMIRNWVGMTGHEEFYDACDRYGLLIWDDFWLANPVDGPDPSDTTMFMNNVRDKIKWVRKHPSLAIYCGRNEGFPPPELDKAMKRETRLLDGTRHYIPHSAEGTVTGLGPYDTREPAWYFANRGITLHSELGIIAFPEVESMRRMMPEKDLWPINNMWAYHDYQWGRSEKFTARIEDRFGKPDGVEDYCRRAQLLNYESARAMFEALQSNQGSGVLLWMSQAAWPSMICQIYDHYFEYTSAFFAVKKACRQQHILWDILKNDIRVANNTALVIKNATARAVVYDDKGTVIWEKSASADVLPAGSRSFFAVENKTGDKVRFLKLQLIVKGKVIDDNFYWLENKSGNCLDLNDLPKADVSVKLTGVSKNGTYTGKVVIRNNSSYLSLLNKLKIKDKKSGESILPVFFSDDYISLLPGEEKTITFTLEENKLKNNTTEIWLEGWNTVRVKTDLTTNK